jgi:hypothetical protein
MRMRRRMLGGPLTRTRSALMAKGFSNPELPKPLVGLLFLLFWAVAIVAWCIVPHLVGHGLRGFIADFGIVFASLGFAVPFLVSKKNLGTALILAVVGILLFALGDFADIQLLVYFLRIFAPVLAVLAPVNKFSNSVKIFS